MKSDAFDAISSAPVLPEFVFFIAMPVHIQCKAPVCQAVFIFIPDDAYYPSKGYVLDYDWALCILTVIRSKGF